MLKIRNNRFTYKPKTRIYSLNLHNAHSNPEGNFKGKSEHNDSLNQYVRMKKSFPYILSFIKKVTCLREL